MFREPISDLWGRLSQAEARLQDAYDCGEPSDGERLDYWLSASVAAAINPHRKSGSPPVRPKELRPGWGWEEMARQKAEQATAEKRATEALMAWAMAMSQGAASG